MRTTERAASALAVAGIVVASLAACGTGGDQQNGANANGGGAAPPESGEITISYRWWGGDERAARQMEVIALFEEQNPGIRIQPMPASFDGFYDTLGIEMAGRNAPDVFTLDRSWPLEYGSRGGLLDLASAPGLDLSPFSEAVLAPSTIGEEVFGVPNGGNATGLIVNVDLFEQAGVELPDENTWTWDDFATLAAQISGATPDGTFGAELRPHDFINAFATQRDGLGLFAKDGTISVAPETLADFFTLHTDLIAAGAAPDASLMSELMPAGPEETLMGRGMSAMLFAPSNQITAYAAASGANLQLLRIPGETEFSHVGTTVLPSQFFAISAHTAHPEAAAAFVDFLVNDPAAGEILGVDRGNPLNVAVADHIAPTLTEVQQEQVDFMGRVAEHAGPTIPQPTGAGEVQSITTRVMDEVVFGRITPDAGATSWLQQMQTALDSAE